MIRTFVEMTEFRKRADSIDVDLARQIQNSLLKRIDGGDVIRGTGGIRKQRFADAGRNKGKRGGLRFLYLDFPHVEKTYLLYLYGKSEKDDISQDEKKQLRSLVDVLKREAR
ncbi:MAG: toxin [Elusimicrobia bacterium CG_4_9_14_3_um_filter_62_55]|nr:MAG: toxin [Elusimicrobia bacterium CG22_combo_CG10-13_8_21_14_all_63_91]PJA17461.1 MAG: toxin [Elusimicrobia bacterium CG_4_10_14_0_2_um_filter_63_34]PJB25467.1 MAG: toxin [Elusimicrobia bacterium CG_4_9_14_3_um_filter_62_55]